MKKTEIGDKKNKFSDFDTSKNEKFEELKSANCFDLKGLVYRMGLSYGEIMDVLDIKHFPSKRTAYILPPGIYEITNINRSLEYLSSDFLK